MNTALQHVGSSKKDADGKQKKKQKLPKAAAVFAKQMGIDLTGLEAEADDIWSMLNNMSEDNPLQYESFVQDQLATKGQPPEDKSNETEGAKYFRPSSGFCVRTITTGGDGIKVREKGQGKKFFINICSHVALEPPRDKAGNPALDERIVADGLQFPMIIGPLRDCKDGDGEDAIAIDVIYHPAVIHHSKLQSAFKSQIVELSLQWIKKDTTVEFNESNWQPLKSPDYMGGRGVDDCTPVLMSVEHAMNQAKDPQETSDRALSRQQDPTFLSGETNISNISSSDSKNVLNSTVARSNAVLSPPQNLIRFSELDKSEQDEVAAEVMTPLLYFIHH